jgi:hypothetical protein
MNIMPRRSLVLALLAGIGFTAVAQERVYLIDQRDVVAKTGFGLCWRDRLLDPGRCRCRQGRLRVRQGPAAEGNLRAEGCRSGWRWRRPGWREAVG